MISFRFEKKPNFFNKNWWGPTKKEWVPHLWLDNRDNWIRQVDDEGKPWEALSPSYAKWKSENMGNLPELRVSGEMLDRSYLIVRGNRFIVKTTEEGIYNQFGTDKMPARPWVGVPLNSLDKLAEIALENLLKP
jgi:hypothetical protein